MYGENVSFNRSLWHLLWLGRNVPAEGHALWRVIVLYLRRLKLFSVCTVVLCFLLSFYLSSFLFIVCLPFSAPLADVVCLPVCLSLLISLHISVRISADLTTPKRATRCSIDWNSLNGSSRTVREMLVIYSSKLSPTTLRPGYREQIKGGCHSTLPPACPPARPSVCPPARPSTRPLVHWPVRPL